MSTTLEHTGYTTHSSAPTVRFAYSVECADRFGEELHRRARQFPLGCMTRVAIEENRPWRVILAAAGCERRTPCGVCERAGFRRAARFRTIALTAGAAFRSHRLAILSSGSWTGIEATRAALTAASRSLARENLGGRTLAALVLGLAWTDLLMIVDDDLAPLAGIDRIGFSLSVRDGWRALLQVRAIASREARNDEIGRASATAPSVRDLSVLIGRHDEPDGPTAPQPAA